MCNIEGFRKPPIWSTMENQIAFKNLTKKQLWDPTTDSLWERFKEVNALMRDPLLTSWTEVTKNGIKSGMQFTEYLEMWRQLVYKKELSKDAENITVMDGDQGESSSSVNKEMPKNYLHKGMLAFVMLGPEGLSSRPNIVLSMYRSPLPGARAMKRVRDDAESSYKPEFNQAELKKLNLKNVKSEDMHRAKSPSVSTTGFSDMSAITEVYGKRTELELEALASQRLAHKEQQMNSLLDEYEKLKNDESLDAEQRSEYKQKQITLRKRKVAFLESNVLNDDY